MRRIRLLAAGVLVLAGAWGGAATVPVRTPAGEIFKNRSGIWYLGSVRTAADFRQRKQAEALVLKQELESLCKLPFRVITTRYFNLAYRCPENEIRFLAHYLERFFHDIYPRYFRYEPRAPFRVVYFRTQREFYEMTGSDAYGFYRSDQRTLYTWARSGHGTLWHEMIHAFVHDNTEAEPQQWFNEGLASFFMKWPSSGTNGWTRATPTGGCPPSRRPWPGERCPTSRPFCWSGGWVSTSATPMPAFSSATSG